MIQASLDLSAPRSRHTAWSSLQPMQRDILQLLCSGWTTPLEALQKANCLSLSQRVGELIRAGYAVEKRSEKLPSGKTCKAYRIEP